jgi:aspartyl-tRNA(Asn)/glutamyl-tRNA(Gln) amidotransferase subunit A
MIHTQSIAELITARAAGEVTAMEITAAYLARIETHAEGLNALITCTPEAARQRAVAIDGQPEGVLAGLPIIHKDNFCTRGVKTSCASRMLDNFIAPYDATVVEKLAAAGAITLGKSNMDEFALGSASKSSFYGAVKNPWNPAHVPGGSSGGSAAAVAAGLAPAATGTDTGGSIRQPAAFCGVTGIKPTYGRVSRYGLIATASSLDHGGCFARSAEDCAHVLAAMAGFDARDATSSEYEPPNYPGQLADSVADLTIGVPRPYFTDRLDSDCRKVIETAIDELKALGARVVDIDLPHFELAASAYYVITSAEFSSNQARYDGVHFGYRCADPTDLEDLYTRSRAAGFGPEVQRRILLGTRFLSADYYNDYYLKAQRVRRLVARDFDNAFAQVDLLAAPVTPTPAFRSRDNIGDPAAAFYNHVYTQPANLAGVPAMSVPAGFVAGLPVGLQLLAPWFEEARLLAAAHAYQQVTDWHTRRPPRYE